MNVLEAVVVSVIIAIFFTTMAVSFVLIKRVKKDLLVIGEKCLRVLERCLTPEYYERAIGAHDCFVGVWTHLLRSNMVDYHTENVHFPKLLDLRYRMFIGLLGEYRRNAQDTFASGEFYKYLFWYRKCESIMSKMNEIGMKPEDEGKLNADFALLEQHAKIIEAFLNACAEYPNYNRWPDTGFPDNVTAKREQFLKIRSDAESVGLEIPNFERTVAKTLKIILERQIADASAQVDLTIKVLRRSIQELEKFGEHEYECRTKLHQALLNLFELSKVVDDVSPHLYG